MTDGRAAGLDRVLDKHVRAGRVPGVVAAVTDRRGVRYRGAFGVAGGGRPLQADSVFRIASMTKLVTSVAVLMLRDEHALDLDAPFRRYFPDFRQPPVLESFDRATLQFTAHPAAREITVRDLLRHTSGFGYWFLNAEIRALMGKEPEYYNPPFLVCEPGSRFQYGIGTDVLGQMIAPLAGMPLDELYARRIFAPLGMRETSYEVPREASKLAALHRLMPHGFEETRNETVGESPRGGNGLYSTADDYLALLRLLLNEGEAGGTRVLTADSVRELTSDQLDGLRAERQVSAAPQRTEDFLFMDGTQTFGLGVLIETRERPSGRAAGSYGWAGIYNTYFWVDPRAGLAAVVLMQVSPFSTPACLDLCERFEQEVYRAHASRRL